MYGPFWKPGLIHAAPMWFAVAVFYVFVSAAAGQHGAGGHVVPGPVGGESGGAGESHAWMVAPAANSDDGVSLIHLPPRDLAEVASAHYTTVADGAIQVVTQLERAPERLCAWERTVFLVFGSERVGEDRKQRRVLSVSASPNPIGKLWTYNTVGRLHVCAALPGDGELIGVVGSEKGPVALIESGAGETNEGELDLLVLHRGQWRSLDLARGPDFGYDSEDTEIHLVGMPQGVGVLVLRRDGRGSLWHARFEELAESSPVQGDEEKSSEGSNQAGAEPSWFEITWEQRAYSFTGSDGRPVFPDGAVYWIRDSLIYAAGDAVRALSIRVATEQSNREIARLFNVPRVFATAPIEQAGRLAILWPAVGGKDDQKLGNGYEIREISVLTGRLMYEGAAHVEHPVSANEFRVLAFMLVVVMVVVLLFVLRSDEGQRAVHLPPDRALVEPGRRAVAGLIDVLPSAWIVGQIYGISITEVFGSLLFLGIGYDLAPLIMTLGLGFAHTTLGEWLFGRSLGKALMGCEVISVLAGHAPGASPIEDEAVKPRLWQAVVRNFVRWAIPPVAVLGMADLSRRHRGDVLARTAVVERVVSEPEVDSEGGEG